MSGNYGKSMLTALLLGMLTVPAAATQPKQSDLSKVTDGLIVYLGVVPASRIADYPELVPTGHRVAPGKNEYHVLVAIFDSSTGERVTDARVEATVTPLGLAGPTKQMKPWVMGGALTYCNFFELPLGNARVIELRIRQPGIVPITTAKFTYTAFPE